ncbi:DNA primase [Brevibacillus fortis]|uniref:DNA primase n=1 Tax=Brevibacillus fortis TaxID=2126352 RepID=UPI002E1FE2FA|nr:DNA primase [Brevibacillus fortis]
MEEWLEQLRDAIGEGAEELEVKIEYEDGTTKKLYFGSNQEDDEDEDEDEESDDEESDDEESDDEESDDEDEDEDEDDDD